MRKTLILLAGGALILSACAGETTEQKHEVGCVAGTMTGAVIGGLAGSLLGGGIGNTLTTAAGAGLGTYAGQKLACG
ncbi:hypothetical protein [Amaricoccus sp.]|uniref:hypothetical protein n=1 Tax=Amaricoccus sp. TaxID=1872485 RepID=UPI002623E829|nr:hypothetical protein [uncultured Amaricoccus sp.]